MSIVSTDNRFQLADSVAPKPRQAVGRVVAMDDDALTLRLLTGHLSNAGYEIQTASGGVAGLELVNDSTAVALVDLRMPDLSGMQVLQHIRQNHPNVQVIILTGSNEVAVAVEAMREGAFQFVTKPFDSSQLLVYVAKAIKTWQVNTENRNLKELHSHSVPVQEIQATGDMHLRLMHQVDRISATDSTVFISGESGTGKSTIARMIHQRSARAKGPFVTVNCASLPRDLLQSELFGHTKGAFTGAVKDRLGHAEVADGGTLFLDEIGDLPIDLQPKLLTFLQDRTIQPLGASESKTVDVRLIAASHRNLADMCREGLFRQDLYFRLVVLNIEIPSLRDRSGELISIAESVLQRVCERQGIPSKRISDSAADRLLNHAWPGNIRELENVFERAVAYSISDEIGPADLVFSSIGLDHSGGASNSLLASSEAYVASPPLSLPGVQPVEQASRSESSSGYSLAGKTLREIERDAIIHTLQATGGNKAKTARVLEISEKSIYNKMRRLNISF